VICGLLFGLVFVYVTSAKPAENQAQR
jgi:hypothetical protein